MVLHQCLENIASKGEMESIFFRLSLIHNWQKCSENMTFQGKMTAAQKMVCRKIALRSVDKVLDLKVSEENAHCEIDLTL